ncbi:dihydrodipicolinate synthase family protein [Sphingopyxis sp.]|jgi:4-hydroxy-tetrahydrodipicolinate synthase|uniref:dihydrodipicolinate synthase family protein n=1 Tax=Sphingopyxis sp. TaxID=1908224 RepID=UPI001E13A8F6|nr:dihydrodipicolinate synthase family protein [Sphingopyxis sp.]MBW8296331.1 dihydrodipicolinate synthase family protein [Sphingopyxis sp.]
MQKSDFRGVFPAITTKMDANEDVDLQGVRDDVRFQVEAGVHGVIVCGSLGEASSLEEDEKIAIAEAALEESAGRVPILMTVAEDSTRAGVRLINRAERAGVQGLMVLPAMRYPSDPDETMTHFRTVAANTDLPIILYNNPIAYTIDLLPEHFAQLADEPKFLAIKESSADTRRINQIIDLVGDRYELMIGVDDLAFESLVLGCSGWIAGLVVAFPRETVAIYELVMAGRIQEALEIYRWFLPLLSLDIGPKFVQKIKLAEHVARGTSPIVRAPRGPLVGKDYDDARAIIQRGLATRPDLAVYGF